MRARSPRRLMTVLCLAGMGACCMPDCAAVRPSADAAPATASASAAPAVPAGAPAMHAGGVGRWPKNDVAEPDPSFLPVEKLDLAVALWGIDIPNALKSMSVAYDSVGQRLYALGIATDRLTILDPAQGHPVGAIDMDIKLHHQVLLRVDEKRRKLFVVGRGDGSVRVVDLDRGEVVARYEGTKLERPGEHGRGYAIRGAAVDPATGWIWVADLVSGTLTGRSPDLAQTKVATGFSGPASVDTMPGGDELVLVDAASRESMRLIHYRPSTDTILSASNLPAAAGPTSAQVAPDGTVVLSGRVLAALGPDGVPKWRADLPVSSEAVTFVGNTVAVVLGDGLEGKAGRPPRPVQPGRGPPSADRKPQRPPREDEAPEARAPERQVLFYDLATGAAQGDTSVRFESHSAAADVAGGRLFVANGGDASVSVIDVTNHVVTSTIDAGNAAEEVVVDSVTGDRYVLNRLGGSVIYRWGKNIGTPVDTWQAGKWPSDLAIDSKRRRLWALGHYEATLMGWDLDTQKALPPLSLGLKPNASDTLGDLDYDPDVGLAAVVFPESGGLAVVDPMAGKVLWSTTVPGLQAGLFAGPGNAFVSVDGKNDRLYVGSEKSGILQAYALRTGAAAGELTLDTGGKTAGYAVNGMWLDQAKGRLFIGNQVVRVPTLQAETTIADIGKVFWTDDKRVLAIAAGGDRGPERLLTLDPKTLALKQSFPLVRTGMMRLAPTYDPDTKRVYAADMAEARVLVWALPD